jgi:hypothetical protein
MLVVVMLLPLSSPMYDGEFDHGGGHGGCGGPVAAVAAEAEAAAAEAAVAGVEDNDGRMTTCDDEIGRRTTKQQLTNERRRFRKMVEVVFCPTFEVPNENSSPF